MEQFIQPTLDWLYCIASEPLSTCTSSLHLTGISIIAICVGVALAVGLRKHHPKRPRKSRPARKELVAQLDEIHWALYGPEDDDSTDREDAISTAFQTVYMLLEKDIPSYD